MKQSKPELMLGIYTHIGISDERRALDRIPTLTRNTIERSKCCLKTVTDDMPIDKATSAYKPAYKKMFTLIRSLCPQMSTGRRITENLTRITSL
ncbi:MAG: hypothetical protein ACYS91_18670 [Planctomycetota bacterium]